MTNLKQKTITRFNGDKFFNTILILTVLTVLTALRSFQWTNTPLVTSNGSNNSFENQNNSVSSVYSKKNYKNIWNKYWFSDENELDYMYMVCNNSLEINNCLRMSISIPYHETKSWKIGVWKYNNLYGMMQYSRENGERKQIPMVFINRMASFEDWNVRYNEFRYNNDCNEMITKSRYTTTQTAEWIQTCNQVAIDFYSLNNK